MVLPCPVDDDTADERIVGRDEGHSEAEAAFAGGERRRIGGRQGDREAGLDDRATVERIATIEKPRGRSIGLFLESHRPRGGAGGAEMELVDRSALPGKRVLDGAVEEGAGERVIDCRRRAGGEEMVPELAADRTVDDEVPGILVGDQPFPDSFCRRRGETLEPLPLDGDKDGPVDISDVGERGGLTLRKGRKDERIPLRRLLAQAVPRGRGSRVAVLRGEGSEDLNAPHVESVGGEVADLHPGAEDGIVGGHRRQVRAPAIEDMRADVVGAEREKRRGEILLRRPLGELAEIEAHLHP